MTTLRYISRYEMILRPALLKRWASYGFFVGLLDGASQIQHPWQGYNSTLNLIDLLSMGIGFATIGLVSAALWNWAGKIRWDATPPPDRSRRQARDALPIAARSCEADPARVRPLRQDGGRRRHGA
jgi:hypothetical protein